jgi:hypothetical protein
MIRATRVRLLLMVVVIVVAAGITLALASTDAPRNQRRTEHHPHADVGLVKFADGGRVVASHAVCSDMTDLGYIKNNSCIYYAVVASATHESEQVFERDEVRRLDRAAWRLFSPRDFGYSAPVVGRDDPYGHDCLLIGPPARVPLAMEYGGRPSRSSFWFGLRQALQQARRKGWAVIGMQMYPGPANDPLDRVC